MSLVASIFLDDVKLPNDATWFYFSALLAIALFFKFTRLLSMRNLDILTLFLLMPGLLLLRENPQNWYGYLWLICGSIYFLVRCLADLALVRRPALGPNLGGGGLVWMAGALFVCLTTVAYRQPSQSMVGSVPAFIEIAQQEVENALAAGGFTPKQPTSPQHFSPATEERGKGEGGPGTATASGQGESAANRNMTREQVGLTGQTCLVTQVIASQANAAGGVPVGPLVQVIAAVKIAELDTQAPVGLSVRFWVGRSFAILCHMAIVAGLIVIGWRHFQDIHIGMAAATFYLLLPCTAFQVSQVHHVWPSALIIWAIAAYRLPALAGLLLGLATGTVYFPLILFPLWFSFYRRRGAGRFAGAFALSALVCLGLMALVLWMLGELDQTLRSALSLSDWQPWKEPKAPGLWRGIHWAYRTPIFIAYLAFVTAMAFWPSPKNLGHVLALTAAALIGIQFWYADRGGVYVLWYLPVFLLIVFRPNLLDRRPLPIRSESDWLLRLQRTLARWATSYFHPSGQAATIK